MSDKGCHDDCGIDSCDIKLFQYSIVTIKRGEERILEYGQKLVLDPMTECEFDAWVILDFAAHHPVASADRQYLRVWSQLLKVWEKQPLHYAQKQLAVLQEISNKLGGPVYVPAGSGSGGTAAGA